MHETLESTWRSATQEEKDPTDIVGWASFIFAELNTDWRNSRSQAMETMLAILGILLSVYPCQGAPDAFDLALSEQSMGPNGRAWVVSNSSGPLSDACMSALKAMKDVKGPDSMHSDLDRSELIEHVVGEVNTSIALRAST